MEARPASLNERDVSALLRGEIAPLRDWTARWNPGRLTVQILTIVAGAGAYGAAMGWWRAPLQGLYVAIKLPLIILLTGLGNALINAMLAPLLGLNISFRQSCLAILASFTVTAAILGGFSPLVAFVVWNAAPLTADTNAASGTYAFIMLINVVIIAFAGMAANLRLGQLLRDLDGASPRASRRVLLAWLACNLFLGSQLSWMLRPFIGSPSLHVQFLRDTPFNGNFYETLFRAIARLLDLN